MFLGTSFAALEIEVADHVVDDTFAPLKGDNDRVMFVSPLQLLRAHQHLDLLLVEYFYRVGGSLQPPHWGSILLLVQETCTE